MPDELVVTWDGHMGLPAVERARADIDRALDLGSARRLVIDLASVAVVEPVAVGLLVHALTRSNEQGVTVVLRGAPPGVKRLLALNGLTRMFTFDGPPPAEVMIENLPRQAALPPEPDRHFDKVAELVRDLVGVPTAMVTLVDQQRQVFPGAVGLPEPWQAHRSTPLSHSFCKYVVDRSAALVVNDSRADPLLGLSPAVSDLAVIAYAGTPITDLTGEVVGALCAIDSTPREWTSDELETLRGLADACSATLRQRARTGSNHAAR